MRRLAAALALATLAIGGCTAAIPTNRFACTSTTDCPPDQVCIERRCHAIGTDGGGTGDASEALDAAMSPDEDAFSAIDAPTPLPPDAGRDAFVPADAPVDTALDAPVYHRLRVLNALEADGETSIPAIRVSVAGSTMAAAFGCAASFTVPPGDVEVQVEAGMARTSPTLRIAEDTLLVIGRNAAGSLLPVTLPDDPPERAHRYLALLGSAGDSGARASHEYVTSADPFEYQTLALGEISTDVPRDGIEFVAVGYTVGLTPVLLASFTFRDSTGAIVVITGSGAQHPGLPGGPRAILVPPPSETCATPILPDPVLAAVHLGRDRSWLGGPDVLFCQIGSGLDAAALGPGQVSGTTTTALGLSEFGMSPRGADPCDRATARIVDLEDPTLLPGGPMPGRRYLSILHGAIGGVAPGSWQIRVVEEPLPVARRATPPYSDVWRGFVHLAPINAAFAVDVNDVSSGLTVHDAVAPGSAVGVESDPATTTRWAAHRDPAGPLLVTLPVGTGAAARAPAFFVLSDADGTGLRGSAIFAPFSTPWSGSSP